MRRLVSIAGTMITVALAIVLSLNLPTALDRGARAAGVAGHEGRLDELASQEAALQARIDEARSDLGTQREQNDDAGERIAKQERRLERLRERIEELDG